jgi:DNA-binding LytR/AlgR family response regulator
MMPPHFVRIHRSYLVNINKVDSIEGNMLRIKEHQLPISKGQREQLMVALRERGLF